MQKDYSYYETATRVLPNCIELNRLLVDLSSLCLCNSIKVCYIQIQNGTFLELTNEKIMSKNKCLHQ